MAKCQKQVQVGSGTTLEYTLLQPGPAPNFACLTQATEIEKWIGCFLCYCRRLTEAGIEPNVYFHSDIHESARAAKLKFETEVLTAKAEQLPLESESVDVVVR